MNPLKDRYQPRYGQWSGCPGGIPADFSLCATEVFGNTTLALPQQCRRARGHGPEGAYCELHAKRFETTA